MNPKACKQLKLKERTRALLPITYLALGQEGARACAHLAHDTLPGLVVGHHRLLQPPLGLNPTTAQQKHKNYNFITQGPTHCRGQQLTSLMRWSHSACERKPLYRNALRAQAIKPGAVKEQIVKQVASAPHTGKGKAGGKEAGG